MSNPVATVDNYIPEPPDPKLTREVLTLINFTGQNLFTYKLGQWGTFVPDLGRGTQYFMSVPLGDVLTGQPSFISDGSWNIIKEKYSVFYSPAWNSFMPKLLIPSKILVDNGINSKNPPQDSAYWAHVADDYSSDLFNWVITSASPPPSGSYYKIAQVGGGFGSQFVVSKKISDASAQNTVVWTLKNPTNPPSGEWDKTKLVVGGAFLLMINITPIQSSAASAEDNQKNPWKITLQFGEVTLTLDKTGALNCTIGSGEAQPGNMIKASAAQGPPQSSLIKEEHYILGVYPVWNGIVVTNGIADASSSIQPTSCYFIKNQKASINTPPYSNGFNVTAPANVIVDCPPDVTVDFGTSLVLTLFQCEAEFAYLPIFFSYKGVTDQFFIVNNDAPGTVTSTTGTSLGSELETFFANYWLYILIGLGAYFLLKKK